MKGGVQAVHRSLVIVRTVAQIQRSGAGLTRIAKAAGLTVPTAYRLLRTLTGERLLTFDPSDRTYRVGPLAFELGLAAFPETPPHVRWQGAVEAVARRTRLTSYLMARSDSEAVCMLCVQGATAIRAMPMEVGQRIPLGIGAGGLAILASLDDDEIRAIVRLHETRYRLFPVGARDEAEVMDRVAQTRADGFSVSTGTVADGVTGVGVMVPKGMSASALAITVSAVAHAFSSREAKVIASTVLDVLAAQAANR
jgi:DNA-binding IclR family transcriptional regulator